ncbi:MULTISPECIES: hypothetical protein [unclassified Iodidimonas]|jgi:hypothetical protein|uniref:hypothetical protein n=1 Tax=unclassified Iodidimonas TaxID=2626145 RepID=UPI002482B3A7|nr:MULTISPECIES: hypothetical protein [unclassified Iodidimonas]
MRGGDTSRAGRQYARPIFIDRLDETGTARSLEPVALDRGDIRPDEAWLQKLIFHGAEDGFYIQPRILARTVNIERGIVRIIDGRVAMEAPQATQDLRASGRRTLISQDRMLEILEKADPVCLRPFRHFLIVLPIRP